MKPKLNLEGLNEQQQEEVIQQYEEWCEMQLIDYFASPIDADVNDDQVEAIDYLLDSDEVEA